VIGRYLLPRDRRVPFVAKNSGSSDNFSHPAPDLLVNTFGTSESYTSIPVQPDAEHAIAGSTYNPTTTTCLQSAGVAGLGLATASGMDGREMTQVATPWRNCNGTIGIHICRRVNCARSIRARCRRWPGSRSHGPLAIPTLTMLPVVSLLHADLDNGAGTPGLVEQLRPGRAAAGVSMGTGNGSTTVSQVDTQYAALACSRWASCAGVASRTRRAARLVWRPTAPTDRPDACRWRVRGSASTNSMPASFTDRPTAHLLRRTSETTDAREVEDYATMPWESDSGVGAEPAGGAWLSTSYT